MTTRRSDGEVVRVPVHYDGITLIVEPLLPLMMTDKDGKDWLAHCVRIATMPPATYLVSREVYDAVAKHLSERTRS